MIEREVWLPIFGGAYSASNLGRIRRDAGGAGANPGRILRARPAPNGYLRVIPYVNGVSHPSSVHRLVAEAFLGPRPSEIQVNHRNGIKTDNRLENLEYVTQSENHRHAFRTGLQHPRVGSAHHNHILTEELVAALRADRAQGMGYPALAKKYGIKREHAWAVAKRVLWRHVA